jgi:hypothetical protein
MNLINGFKERIEHIENESFDDLALSVFFFQAKNNKIYRQYIDHAGLEIESVTNIDQIPFLPIEFFKWHPVKSLDWEEECLFRSSGTTGSLRSTHYIEDLEFYRQNSLRIFNHFMGSPTEYVFFGLLPSYQEHNESSLIDMVNHLMSLSPNSGGYYQDNFRELEQEVKLALDEGKQVILFGVGYALLDFALASEQKLDGLIIIETGGMKGRREEIIKSEFYGRLRKGLGAVKICSEYGMTELLSQAYNVEGEYYKCPAQMKVLIRDINDPFSYVKHNKLGGINVIDLANVHSCSFIETQDLGRMATEGFFEVLGRIDAADIRGCNLLVT